MQQMTELPDQTREFLANLRPEELKSLRVLVELSADDIQEGFKLVRDVKTVGRFGRWFTLTVVSILVAAVVFYENVIKLVGYIKGTP